MAGGRYEAVVFDFGGVICTPIVEMLVELAEYHRTTVQDLLVVLLGPPTSTPDHPWHRGERGELATAEFQRAVVPFAEAAGIDLRGDEYDILLAGNFEIDDDVVADVADLAGQGYKTALLTNSFREFRDIIGGRLDYGLFDAVVDSSQVGARKPDRKIYEVTADRLGVAHDAIVFLDDFAGNVAGARDVGWTTIHVTDVANARAELRRLLAT